MGTWSSRENTYLRAARFLNIPLKLPARKRLGTRWAKYPLGRRQAFSTGPDRGPRTRCSCPEGRGQGLRARAPKGKPSVTHEILLVYRGEILLSSNINEILLTWDFLRCKEFPSIAHEILPRAPLHRGSSGVAPPPSSRDDNAKGYPRPATSEFVPAKENG